MEKLLTPSKVAYKTKKELVFQNLRNAIMECELIPNQKLVISNIAKQLKVSSIPVREALQQLHSEGLIQYNPHMGAIVAPITKSSVVEAFTIKEGLEVSAAGIIGQSMTSTDAIKLEELLVLMDQVIESGDFQKWGDLNEEFHRTIIEITSMPLLIEMHAKVMDKWRRIQHYFFSEVLVNRNKQSQKEHYEIFHFLKDNESERAAELIKMHNRYALEDYMKYLEKQGHRL